MKNDRGLLQIPLSEELMHTCPNLFALPPSAAAAAAGGGGGEGRTLMVSFH